MVRAEPLASFPVPPRASSLLTSKSEFAGGLTLRTYVTLRRVVRSRELKAVPGGIQVKINLCSALSASMIPRTAFVTAGTFHVDFVPNNMMGVLCSGSFPFADVAGTARSDIAQSRD